MTGILKKKIDMQERMEKLEKKIGKLYICATPIGNLGDISLRVLKVLEKVDLIAAEDTRNSAKLLNHFNIKTPMTSYHEHNRFEKADELVAKMLYGARVALITDAGTPCISDPGEVLVQKCIEAGIELCSLPGASAVITALTLSGFLTERFVFEGFLPPKQKKKLRLEALERLRSEPGTIVLYEAPHHLKSTLLDLIELLGADRRLCLCKEMTKIHETIVRTTLSGALDHEPKGEYVLVIEGLDKDKLLAQKREAFSDIELADHIQLYLSQGLSNKEAMKKVALDRGMTRREVYNILNKND